MWRKHSCLPALLPTLAASGPQKRRVETRRGTQKCVRHDSRCEVILALLLSYCGHRRPTHTTICGWASPPAPPNAAGALPCISGRKPTSRGVILRLRGETTSGCGPTHAPPIARNRGPRRADEIARGVADAGPAPTRGPSFPGEIGDARHVLGCHERQTAAGDGRMTTRPLWIAAGCAAVLASTQDRALW